MTRIPGYLVPVRFPARRIAVGAAHDLRRVSLVLLVGAIVVFTPLLWQMVDDELAPTPTTREAPAASATSDDWIVVSRDGFVILTAGSGVFQQACITYTSPGGTQERCQNIGVAGKSDSPWHDEAEQCWGQSRIGDPLPDCWR